MLPCVLHIKSFVSRRGICIKILQLIFFSHILKGHLKFSTNEWILIFPLKRKFMQIFASGTKVVFLNDYY